ncbi:MAG: hypothetical protein K6F86_00955 [Lachnospiraceae bacterium]|nr:hypothetical protein [Lachnospiraceae bacterium]
MSKELEKLENMAAATCITDHDHIERIINYLFSLPFSYFEKDEVRYRFLRDNLCYGFKIDPDMRKLSVEDVLILIGYEPGNHFFDPPDADRKGLNRKFNSAGHSYVMALLISIFSKKDIRIKEFTRIRLSAYVEYLKKKVEEEYRNELVPFSICRNILHKVDEFKHKTGRYLSDLSQTGAVSENEATLGDVISGALAVCGRGWGCPTKPLEIYASEIIESYDLLNRFFMDAVRTPLICSDRERFQEIVTRYIDKPFNNPVKIDFETCYEHGGIIRQ